MVHKVESELTLDAKRAPRLRGPSIAGWMPTILSSLVSRSIEPANTTVGADGAGLLNFARSIDSTHRFLIGEGTGRTGLHTLTAEGARRVSQLAIELGGDLRVEAAVHDTDCVIALLLCADADAPVAGDTEIVVAQDKGILVVGITRPRLCPDESAGARFVAVHERC